jgi:uncharacterized protein YfaS (alpha-2-macroglobulin family)
LYYEARLRYAREKLPTIPVDFGFFVEKSLRSLKPEELSALASNSGLAKPRRGSQSVFAAGDLVLAELSVVSSGPAEYVVIDDPLPAGFEAINTTLATTSSRYREFEATACDGCQPDEPGVANALSAPATRTELRDERALFFVDHMPPGIFRYRYLARATTRGRYVLPPTHVEAMYQPETFGRTSASQVEVR